MANIENTMLPWYRRDIGPRLRPYMKKLFETYSEVPGGEIEEHLHRIRDEAWEIKTYPCIGQWQWLTSATPLLPIYPSILQRIKASDTILDLGCCFGQDLRSLAADGAPTGQMFASDILSNFWELSYDLYQDRAKMNAQFIQADVFDPESKLQALKGRMDIVLVSQFLHLWNWPKQVEIAKTIISLTKPGAWIVGHQIGSALGREVPFNIGGNNSGLTMFLHNVETVEKMWKHVGDEVNVTLSVDASVCNLTDWLLPEDCDWMGKSSVGLQFVIRRLDG